MVLLRAGARVNHSREADGRTPLHVVCDEGAPVEVFEALLSAGADVNLEDFSSWTPLHCAACMGDAAYVAALLKAGANVDFPNISGQTPLLLACESCGSRCSHSHPVVLVL